jgi:hypothetical protein
MEHRADLVDVEGTLRDQDHVGAARDAGVQRDPSGVAAHHLADQDPVVALRRRVEAVDGLARDAEGGVEPEGDVGAAEVVVDRLRDAQDRGTVAVELVGGAERVLAADRDQAVDLEVGERLPGAFRALLVLVDVGPGGSEDRPAAVQDPPRRVDREVFVVGLEDPAPAVVEADDLVLVNIDALADDRADDRV